MSPIQTLRWLRSRSFLTTTLYESCFELLNSPTALFIVIFPDRQAAYCGILRLSGLVTYNDFPEPAKMTKRVSPFLCIPAVAWT